MDKVNVANAYKSIDEMSEFFKFGRRKIAQSLKETVKYLENEVEVLFNQKEVLATNYHKLSMSHHELQKKHDEIDGKYDLVSRILAAQRTDNHLLESFNLLVEYDFMEFANEESSLAQEARAIIMMQNIQHELLMISSFPSIYNKNIVAVGGGFSAGKSEFISSFFEDKTITLPIGIKPMTAIPTYIASGNEHLIKGYSYKGGSMSISPSLYSEISHDFIKAFNFNLKDILPFMAIETKIETYQDICFIDTPGYNPSDTGFTGSDYETANRYLENANVLLWVIGLDASDGAVPASDLEFLEKIFLDNKKLYVIANKADIKSPDDLEDILDNLEETFEDYDIEIKGISAYSSIKKREIGFRKQSLFEFLKKVNNPISAKQKTILELTKIFDMYETAIQSDIRWTKHVQSHFHSLELDLMQTGYETDNELVSERLEKMRAIFETKNLEKQLKKLQILKETMIESVNEIFEHLSFKE